MKSDVRLSIGAVGAVPEFPVTPADETRWPMPPLGANAWATSLMAATHKTAEMAIDGTCIVLFVGSVE